MKQFAGAATRSVVRHAAQTGCEAEPTQDLPTSAAIGSGAPPNPNADDAVRQARHEVGGLSDESVA